MLYSVKEEVRDNGPFGDVIEIAHQMQGSGAVSELLSLSAALLEHCAYELARSEGGGQVSRIILIAAELERMARDAVMGDAASMSCPHGAAFTGL